MRNKLNLSAANKAIKIASAQGTVALISFRFFIKNQFLRERNKKTRSLCNKGQDLFSPASIVSLLLFKS